MPERDPLIDPQPGDVVRMWFRPPDDPWFPWFRTVLERNGDAVVYESNSKPGVRLTEEVIRWQLIRWSNQAQVIHVAG